MFEDDYTDNQNLDDELLNENLDEELEGDDTDEQGNQGNLAKALQEERRKRKDAEKRASERDAELRRANTLLERLGQGGNQTSRQDIDPDEYRSQLQNWMLERPDEFVMTMQQHQRRSLLQEFAPVLAGQAERIIARNPDHKAVYDLPEVQEIVDAFIANEVQNGSIQGAGDLQGVVSQVMDAIIKIRNAGGQGGQGDPAKKRLSTTVGKGGSTSSNGKKSVEEIWEEKAKLARTDRQAYMKWRNSPEGKKVRAALLQGQ